MPFPVFTDDWDVEVPEQFNPEDEVDETLPPTYDLVLEKRIGDREFTLNDASIIISMIQSGMSNVFNAILNDPESDIAVGFEDAKKELEYIQRATAAGLTLDLNGNEFVQSNPWFSNAIEMSEDVVATDVENTFMRKAGNYVTDLVTIDEDELDEYLEFNDVDSATGEWMRDNLNSLSMDYYRVSGKYQGDFEDFLNKEGVAQAEYAIQDEQLIGSTDKHYPIIEDKLRTYWRDTSLDFQDAIRENIITRAQAMQLTGDFTQREVAELMAWSGEARYAANSGIERALKTLPGGTNMVKWAQENNVNLYWDFFLDNRGTSPAQLAAIVGSEYPEFEAIRLNDPSIGKYIPPELETYLGRLPLALRAEVEAQFDSVIGPGVTKEQWAQLLQNELSNLGDFFDNQLEAVMVGLYGEEVREHVRDTPHGSFMIWAEELNLPRLANGDQINQAVQQEISPLEEDAAEIIDAKFDPISQKLPGALASQLIPAVENELVALAEQRGQTVKELIDSGVADDLLERGLKTALGDRYKQFELIAQINDVSVTSLFENVQGDNLTLDEIIEQAAQTELVEVAAGEDQEISEARGALAEIVERLADAETAREVTEDIIAAQNEFAADNPELLQLQEERRQQQIREQVEDTFIREPAGERISENVGQFFRGRQRDRIIRELQPQLQDEFVNEFRARNERIRTENERTGAEVLGPEISAKDFFDQNVDRFTPDRDRQLSTLRELQSQDRLVFSGVARRRRNRRFG